MLLTDLVNQLIVNFMQMSVAVKKILYAADAKESPLAEAQKYLYQTLNVGEAEDETEAEAEAETETGH